jgi:hypothetical protein
MTNNGGGADQQPKSAFNPNQELATQVAAPLMICWKLA